MAERFFLSSPIIDNQGKLDHDQAHHATHVMRYGVGDSIVLFDEQGHEYVAQIVQLGRQGLTFKITNLKAAAPLPHPKITIASALPKGDRQKFLIEKLVELGCDRLIPLKTQRSVSVVSANTLQRFKKGVIEACKQSGRSHLMEVLRELSVAQLIDNGLYPSRVLKLLADPLGQVSLSQVEIAHYDAVVVAIGPEGGFCDSEVEDFREGGWQAVRLSPFILRVETAALLCAGQLMTKREFIKAAVDQP